MQKQSSASGRASGLICARRTARTPSASCPAAAASVIQSWSDTPHDLNPSGGLEDRAHAGVVGGPQPRRGPLAVVGPGGVGARGRAGEAPEEDEIDARRVLRLEVAQVVGLATGEAGVVAAGG